MRTRANELDILVAGLLLQPPRYVCFKAAVGLGVCAQQNTQDPAPVLPCPIFFSVCNLATCTAPHSSFINIYVIPATNTM